MATSAGNRRSRCRTAPRRLCGSPPRALAVSSGAQGQRPETRGPAAHAVQGHPHAIAPEELQRALAQLDPRPARARPRLGSLPGGRPGARRPGRLLVFPPVRRSAGALRPAAPLPAGSSPGFRRGLCPPAGSPRGLQRAVSPPAGSSRGVLRARARLKLRVAPAAAAVPAAVAPELGHELGDLVGGHGRSGGHEQPPPAALGEAKWSTTGLGSVSVTCVAPVIGSRP